MDGNRFWRQLDICPPEKLAFPITVIGAGAIGSAVVVTLAKMGCSNITVYDGDTLEEHNIPNQMCLVEYLGSPKVDALAHLVEMLCEVKIRPLCSHYRGQRLTGVVISAVDSLETRAMIWKSVKLRRQIELFIDARMGAEILRLFAIRPTNTDDIDRYEESLYDGKGKLRQAEQLPCSARSIIYCPALAGSFVAAQVKRLATSQRIQRDIIFDFSLMGVITENGPVQPLQATGIEGAYHGW